MEQRRLRLGDILDDYCPRERRVTNHAVVAMIEEDVKQTRCTTCDAEHAYKGARVPKRRKKETPSGLFKEVLAGMPEIEEVAALAAAPAPAVVAAPVIAALAPEPSTAPPTVNAVPSHPSTTEDRLRPMHSDDHDDIPAPTSAPQSHAEFSDVTSQSDDQPPTVDGPVHRQLIRATLPRPEGLKDARPVTDFTVRHAPPRGNGHGSFRGGDRDRTRMRGGGSGHGNGNGNGHSNANGNRAQSSGARFQGNRPPGSSRQPTGRAGAPAGFRSSGPGQGSKRGRGGSRG